MPPPTLVATPGAANANAYATLAQADAYHEAHAHGDTWRETYVERKQRALLTATRLLDQHIVWGGTAASTTQRLAWPRTGLLDANGNVLSSTAIPERIAEACAELARQLLAADRTADNDAQGLTSLTVGSISMTWATPAQLVKVLPDAVWYLVALWGTVRTRSMEGPIALSRA
jgi:hypothetical protein